MVSWVTESLQFALLRDDRVCLHAAEYKQLVQDELTWLAELPASVWLRLAAIRRVEMTACTLFDIVWRAAMLANAFLHYRGWQFLESDP